MEELGVQRRLAAILVADMVGYSRLMEADETGTIAQLKAHRKEIIDPTIAERHGRIVKVTGDAMLVEFHSVVDAVLCAVEVQRTMKIQNSVAPEDRRVEFRVGVNLSDVVIDEDDILGEGVNVAARLEGLAEPGGVCISRTVYNHVKNKVDLEFEDLGERQVKNIAEPLSIYRVLIDSSVPQSQFGGKERRARWRRPVALAAVAVMVAVGAVAIWLYPRTPQVEPALTERTALPLPDKPSIAVLPFANMSGDPEQEYFADGMTDDLITDLSKVSGLFVISRNSVFTYKGKPVKVQQVAQELGVHYVLEGSVRKAGNEVRINAQLIDASTGLHLWAERYDGQIDDVFDL